MLSIHPQVGPALAAGCTVVIKPAEQTPLSALALCAIAHEAGLPPGVMNCLPVSREDVEGVGLALCHSPLLRKLSFTGSTGVGKWLMRESASTMKRVGTSNVLTNNHAKIMNRILCYLLKLSLELGGNAPFLVFEDADIKVAVNALMASKFRNAGQACIASNRVLVQEGILEAFTTALLERVRTLRCGNGLDPSTSIGPLIDHKGLDKVNTFLLPIAQGRPTVYSNCVCYGMVCIGCSCILIKALTLIYSLYTHSYTPLLLQVSEVVM